MAMSGTPHSPATCAVADRSVSMRSSCRFPTLMWTLTASAPSLMASSTVQTRVLMLGSSEKAVLPDRCTIRAVSPPREPRLREAMPLWTTTAFAPPSVARDTACRMSAMPAMGPTLTPWSMGTITVLPVFRFMMRRSRFSLPVMIRFLQRSKNICCLSHSVFLRFRSAQRFTLRPKRRRPRVVSLPRPSCEPLVGSRRAGGPLQA